MFGLTMQDVERYQKLEQAGYTVETMIAVGIKATDLDNMTVAELIERRHAYEQANRPA